MGVSQFQKEDIPMINFIKSIVVKAINFVKSLFVKAETVTTTVVEQPVVVTPVSNKELARAFRMATDIDSAIESRETTIRKFTRLMFLRRGAVADFDAFAFSVFVKCAEKKAIKNSASKAGAMDYVVAVWYDMIESRSVTVNKQGTWRLCINTLIAKTVVRTTELEQEELELLSTNEALLEANCALLHEIIAKQEADEPVVYLDSVDAVEAYLVDKPLFEAPSTIQ
jgi:hypothetical protein